MRTTARTFRRLFFRAKHLFVAAVVNLPTLRPARIIDSRGAASGRLADVGLAASVVVRLESVEDRPTTFPAES